MKNDLNLKDIDADFVQVYLDKFDNAEDERYRVGDEIVLKLFQDYPSNTNINEVLLKVSVLNDMYSTNIYATFKMAKHIVSLQNLDKKLSQGDLDAVDLIATGHGIKSKKNEKEINFYSFATKYCSWSNIDKYCIYDSFVDEVLWAYQKRDNISKGFKFERKNLKSSKELMKIVMRFKETYGLQKFSFQKIDKFLWMYGKEKFPAKYSKV